MNPEGEKDFVKKVMESINKKTLLAEQQKDVEMEDTASRLEDEVKTNNEKQKSPF